MLADQPVVDYPSSKKKKSGKKNKTGGSITPNVSEYAAMTAQQHLEELRANGRGKLDLSQFDFGSNINK